MQSLVNKKARHYYEILETFEAGLKLAGTEVKSLKNGRLSYEGSYITIRDGQAWWVNAHIPAYQPKNAPKDYTPDRPRKLLLHKRELEYLIGKSQEKGLTIIPLKVYNARGTLKLEVGVARRKNLRDKREDLKKQAHKRDIQRELRDRL